MTRGYRREEVDAFLDDIIADYQKCPILIVKSLNFQKKIIN